MDGGKVASTDLGWIHTVFDALTGIFDQVGLKIIKKNVGMVCHPCGVFGIQADKAYTRWMTKVIRRYKERQRERVNCPNFRKDLARGSLDTGGAETGRSDPAEVGIRGVVVHLDGGGKGGGGVLDNVDVHLVEAEYGLAVHC